MRARPVAVWMRVLAIALAIAAPASGSGGTKPARSEADAPQRGARRPAAPAAKPKVRTTAPKVAAPDPTPQRPVAVASPAVDVNALLDEEGNGTVFHKDGVDERVARASLLQPRIDAWAEGSVIALEDGKLVIYGKKLPYATLYARMMKDIGARTVGLLPPVREHRVKEIQKEWQRRKFAAEELEPPKHDEELTFRLAKSGELALVDEDCEVLVRVTGPLHLPAASVNANATALGAPVAPKAEDSDEPPNDHVIQEARDAAKIIAAKTKVSPAEALHVGDKIRVGYDSTQSPAMAFIAFPVARPSSVVAIDTEQD